MNPAKSTLPHAARLTPPPLPGVPGGWIDRRPLLDRLDEGHRAAAVRLILISAPAGYGKTSLVSAWLSQATPAFPLDWLRLEPADSDPVQYLADLSAAIHRPLGAEDAPGVEDRMLALLRAFADLPDGHLLVLDDYQAIENPAAQAITAFLLENLPAGRQICLITRADPPLALSRMRGRGQVVEIRQRDLRFSDEEAVRFLSTRTGGSLSPADCLALNRRIEGWASGLELAALSFRNHPGALVTGEGYILDYLFDEVMAGLDAATRAFLMRTCILETLNPEVCAALLEPPQTPAEVAQTLAALERANLFLTTLDPAHTIYRYHPLFASLLKKLLYREDPALAADLHGRAGRWFEQAGQVDPAIRHAAQSAQPQRAVELLVEAAPAMWQEGRHASLLSLIQAIPTAERARQPALRLLQAGCLISNGRDTEAERLLDGDAALPDGLRSQAAAIRALIAAYRGDAQQSGAQLDLARRLAPDGHVSWLAQHPLVEGTNLLRRQDFTQAAQALEGGLREELTTANPLVYLNTSAKLAMLWWGAGQVDQASRTVQEALAYAITHGYVDHPLAAGVYSAWGFLYAQRGVLDLAGEYLDRGLALSRAGGYLPLRAFSLYCAVDLRIHQQDLAGVEQLLGGADVNQILRQAPDWLQAVLAAQQAWLWTRQGKPEQARQYLNGRGISLEGSILYPHVVEYLALSDVLVAQGEGQAADTLYTHILEFAAASGQACWLTPVHIQRANLAASQGRPAQAGREIEAALKAARQTRQIQALSALSRQSLAVLRGRPELVALAKGMLPAAALTSPLDDPLVEALSEREMDVLRGIAAGLSNRQIAERLCVSLQTIKFHNGNIYGKLGVENRVQALQKARALGLLPVD